MKTKKAEIRIQESEVRIKRQPSKSFKDLIVWQKAHFFVLTVSRFSEFFPKNEIYGLTPQFRRAAISNPANIAEGFKKKTKPEKLRYFTIAQGSLEECRYYLILAQDLRYGDVSQLMIQMEEVSKLLEAYISSILDSDS